VSGGAWDISVVIEVRDWIDSLDEVTPVQVVAAVDLLAEPGP